MEESNVQIGDVFKDNSNPFLTGWGKGPLRLATFVYKVLNISGKTITIETTATCVKTGESKIIPGKTFANHWPLRIFLTWNLTKLES